MGPGRRLPLIALFTDFGPHGPYLGQMRLVLAGCAPDCPVVDLLNDAPAFDPTASAHLLAALTPDLPRASVLLGVVDPGVGTHRAPVASTKRRARMDVSPTATVRASAKDAAPSTTVTPKAARRSPVVVAALAARTAVTWSRTRARLT